MLKALADVYGLRVTEPSGKDKAVQIARPLFRVPLEAEALRDCVWGVVPEPLQRAVHRGSRDVIDRDEKKVLQAPPSAGIFAALDRIRQRQDDYWNMPGKVQMEAVRRLQLSFAQNQRLVPNTFVPVATLAEPDREAFGLALMTDLLDALRTEYDRPTPGWITNFDQLVVRGGLLDPKDTEGKWMFALNVAYPDPTGTKLLDGPGAGGVPYAPPQP